MSIYIMSNESHLKDSKFKIGKTTQGSKGILRQYSRGLSEPQLLFHHPCSNCDQVEAALHDLLRRYRITDDQEWFKIDYFTLLIRVIAFLRTNNIDPHFVRISESDRIINRLTVKQINSLGFTVGKKVKLVECVKRNPKTLLKLDDHIKLKITGCNRIGEANSCIETIISDLSKDYCSTESGDAQVSKEISLFLSTKNKGDDDLLSQQMRDLLASLSDKNCKSDFSKIDSTLLEAIYSLEKKKSRKKCVIM